MDEDSSEDGSDKSRRRFLLATGSMSLVGLAGCLGSGGGGHHGDGHHSEKPQDNLEMPEGRETCVSIGGVERDPGGVSSKDAAQYQKHPNYQGDSGYIEMCANCRFFCPVNSPDKVGACAAVDGGIHSQHWCALWQAAENVENLDRPSAGQSRG